MGASDEELLDEISAAIGTLPEPVAAAATSVDVAIAEGDTTGVRKRCFELGIAVVRYGVSVALAFVAEALGERRAPPPLAKSLSRAARMSDGSWCALLRLLGGQLQSLSPAAAPLFGFAKKKALTELVAARNRFVHDGARGDDAAAHCWAVLQQAEALLSLPLAVVTDRDEPSYQLRMGVPIRAGVWRKKRKPLPEHASVGAAYAMLDDRWLPLAPWLPFRDQRLLLVDGPHNSGKPWRWLDPETHERHADDELDRAVRKLMGDDTALPALPTERPNLVGRAEALSILQATADKARSGGIYVVALTGPQGIGRGRLLESVRESAAAFGFDTVVDANCSQLRRSMLRPLRRALSDAEGLEQVRAAIAQACSGDALAGSAGLEAAVEAVEEALVDASQEQPLVVTIDDAQWADDTTLSLLTLLTERASRKAKGNMLIVTAVRDEPGASQALAQFIGEVERDVGLGATRVELAPLEESDARTLTQGVAPLSPELSASLVAGAAGVPFYLVQSVHAWFETNALAWKDGAWHPARDTLTAEPIPGMVDVVQARLSSCFEPQSAAARMAGELLYSAALAGGWLSGEQLLTVLEAVGAQRRDAEHVLEALVDAAILAHRDVGHEYGFAQPMVEQAVLESLRRKPWAERVQRALLEVLSQSKRADEDAAFVADGYATLGDETQAMVWLRRAIDYGLRVGLFQQAAHCAKQLFELAPDEQVRAEAMLARADALLKAGEAMAAREALDVEVELDAVAHVRARILRMSIAAVSGEAIDDGALIADADAQQLGIEARMAVAKRLRGPEGLKLADQAAALLAVSIEAELAYRVTVLRVELLAEMRGFDDPACLEAVKQTRAIAHKSGSAWAVLDTENDWAMMEAAAGNDEQAIRMMADVAKRAQEQHFGSMRRGALVNVATLLLRAGKHAAAASAANHAAMVAHEAGDVRYAGMARSVEADALRSMGQLQDACAAIDDAIAIAESAGGSGLALRLLRRADIRAELGDATEARADAELALTHARELDNARIDAHARLRLAMIDGDTAVLSELVGELANSRVAAHPAIARLLAEARALVDC